MKLNTAGVVAVVALVALAGCTGFAPGGTPGASPADDSPETAEPTETTDNNDQMTDDDEQMTDNDDQMTDDDDETTSDSGLVRFYISDEENAIGDFEHLNVTISEVGFQMADDSDAGTDDGETDGDADETPENDTTAPPENTTDAPYNGTEVPEDTETENDEADDEDESGEWVEHEVDDRTFDLTQLQGANASLLEEFDVPEGSYNKVFVHVEEINGTLDNGESVNVKLPSEKLQITQSFTVEANDSVDFVFDITVHKAGNSGKYILTPVISESGTDVPIEDVDADESEDEQGNESEDEQENESEDEQEESEDETNEAEMELNASFVGAVEPGENATVQVSSNGSAVANATVMVEEEVVGETDQTGELTFAVPEDVDELEITIESGDADLELKVEFEDPPPA